MVDHFRLLLIFVIFTATTTTAQNAKWRDYFEEIDKDSSPCVNGTMEPNDSECKTYYECVNENWVQKQCEEGSFYNPKEMKCQSDYVCTTVNTEQEVLTSSSTNPDTICNDGEYRIDLEKCATYWECVNVDGINTLVEKNCPQGQRFNLALKTCQPSPCFTTTTVPSVPAQAATTTTTTSRPEKEPPCQESPGISGFRSDAADSRRYFQCAQGQWVHMDCPVGLVWNPRALVCDWPKKTVCDTATSKCT